MKNNFEAISISADQKGIINSFRSIKYIYNIFRCVDYTSPGKNNTCNGKFAGKESKPGYLTDVEWHSEETTPDCFSSHQNSTPNAVKLKNINSKFENVDAYFVDTLNKSMAECETRTKSSQSTMDNAYDERRSKIAPANGSTTENLSYTNGFHTSPGPRKSSPKNQCIYATITKTLVRATLSADNSSSDSCGSSFIPVGAKLSEKCQSTPLELDQVTGRAVRSSSMCSMPEFAMMPSLNFNNSESMPNITSNGHGCKLLAASQLISSSSLSESDNMSEQSGYVSSRRSSAGSTNQVTPTGKSLRSKNLILSTFNIILRVKYHLT